MSNIQNDLRNLGDQIIKDAKANAPVRTGKLKASLEYQENYSNQDNFGLTFTELEYGKYVNDNKHLTDSINKNLPIGIENIKKTLTEDILSSLNKINK